MITETKKSQKTILLEKLRNLWESEDEMSKQIDYIISNFNGKETPTLNFTNYSLSSETIKDLKSGDFNHFIDGLVNYYKVIYDDKEFCKSFEQIFRTGHPITLDDLLTDEERERYKKTLYNRSYASLYQIKTLLSDYYKRKIGSEQEFFESLAFTFGLKPSRWRLLKDSLADSKWRDIFDENGEELSSFLARSNGFLIPNLTIPVFFDLEDERLTLSGDPKRTLKLGSLTLGIKKDKTKTPLYRALSSNDDKKIKERLTSQITSLMKKAYKENFTEERLASSYINSPESFPALFVSEESIAKLGNLLDIKCYYNLAGESEMDKILRSIENYLRN